MKTFKKQLDELSDFALEISGIKNDYTEEDMTNASLVFMEVFSSLMFDEYSKKMNEEQLNELFLECGTSIHQTVLLFTGIDLKKVNNN